MVNCTSPFGARGLYTQALVYLRRNELGVRRRPLQNVARQLSCASAADRFEDCLANARC